MHVAVAPFLEPDHPLGVGPVERLVEDLAVDGADGIGRQDQALSPPPAPRPRPFATRGRPRRTRGRHRAGLGLVDVGGVDLELIARLGQQAPAPRRCAGQNQVRSHGLSRGWSGRHGGRSYRYRPLANKREREHVEGAGPAPKCAPSRTRTRHHAPEVDRTRDPVAVSLYFLPIRPGCPSSSGPRSRPK